MVLQTAETNKHSNILALRYEFRKENEEISLQTQSEHNLNLVHKKVADVCYLGHLCATGKPPTTCRSDEHKQKYSIGTMQQQADGQGPERLSPRIHLTFKSDFIGVQCL